MKFEHKSVKTAFEDLKTMVSDVEMPNFLQSEQLEMLEIIQKHFELDPDYTLSHRFPKSLPLFTDSRKYSAFKNVGPTTSIWSFLSEILKIDFLAENFFQKPQKWPNFGARPTRLNVLYYQLVF